MKSKVIASLLSICLILSVFTACQSKKIASSSSPSTKASSSPTVKASTAPTNSSAVSTATAVPVVANIAEAEKGKPFKGASVLLSENFDNNDFDASLAELQQSQAIEFKDGKMTVGIAERNWGCYNTVETFSADGSTYNQVEYSVTFNTLGEIDKPVGKFIALFVGVRINGNIIPTEVGGFWVAFSNQKIVTVYPGTSCWPLGAVDIEIPVDPSTIQTVTVIDNGSKIYYYITGENGADYLIFRADLTESNIKIIKNDGSVAYECANQLSAEGSFKLFNHFAVTYIDKLSIKGAK